jgi:hypothetical protein
MVVLGILYACLAAALLCLAAIIFLWPKKAARLSYVKESEKIFQKLNSEISIFNKLKLRLPQTRGLPDLYTKWLGRLHINPKEILKSTDPIEKIMYLYAAARLYHSTFDMNRKRQLYKNILYVFNTRKVFKPTIPYAVRPLELSNQSKIYAVKQPLFKYLESKFTPRSADTRFSYSYAIKKHDGAEIKNFVAKVNNFFVDCFDIVGNYTFSYDFHVDKMRCTFSHTADTFFCTYNGVTTAVCVLGAQRINFETNIATAEAFLTLYINLKNRGEVRVIKTDTKAAAAMLVGKIKQTKIEYLQSPEQIEKCKVIEDLYSRASISKYISGEKLKNRLPVVAKYLPTLSLPTLVYDIADADELFAFMDSFEIFKTIAVACKNFNIVVMYSSQNDIVREFIQAFTNRAKAVELIKSGVFLFFVDKISAAADAIYYFSKMLEAGNMKTVRSVESNETYIFSRKACSYSITDPKNEVVKYHRLSKGQEVYDEFGNKIAQGYDAICRLPAYIVSWNLRKCTAAATTMRMSLAKSKTRQTLQKKSLTEIRA